MLVLLYERGPFAILRLFDYNGTVLDASNLVSQYIQHGNTEKSLNLLLTLDWNTNPEQCLASLQTILNCLFRLKFTPNVEAQIQKALGSFYAPLRPISNATKSEIGDQIADLTRKFFHALIRHQLYEKAFCLAIDIGDHDLFMDLYFVSKDHEMAAAALARANDLITSDSETSCSECSSDSDISEPKRRTQLTWDNIPPLPNVTITPTKLAPPLPSVNQPDPEQPKLKPFSRIFPPVPVIVHKTISLNIPPVNSVSSISSISQQVPLKINVPLNTPSTSGGAAPKLTNERGEKNVKFSDTVTAFIVPELPRTKRTLNQITNHPFITNPKRELQDSLPLCHPEDEYLKDFAPISTNREEGITEEPTNNNTNTNNTNISAPKIKVVHFGMV